MHEPRSGLLENLCAQITIIKTLNQTQRIKSTQHKLSRWIKKWVFISFALALLAERSLQQKQWNETKENFLFQSLVFWNIFVSVFGVVCDSQVMRVTFEPIHSAKTFFSLFTSISQFGCEWNEQPREAQHNRRGMCLITSQWARKEYAGKNYEIQMEKDR